MCKLVRRRQDVKDNWMRASMLSGSYSHRKRYKIKRKAVSDALKGTVTSTEYEGRTIAT